MHKLRKVGVSETVHQHHVFKKCILYSYFQIPLVNKIREKLLSVFEVTSIFHLDI